jgi:DNA-binding SARP family transcriptional activator/DNA-binding XRE family transcriptional regulator
LAVSTGLGDALATYRRRAGLTQQEVATRAAVSVAGLRDIEQGRVAAPKAQTLRRLGLALGLSPAEAEDLAQRGRPATEPTGRVWIGVLGPLVVRVDGVDVDPGSEIQRVLLGTLALSPNVPISRELLLERASAAGRPSMTAGGLAARMSRLRRRLRSRSPGAAAPSLVAGAGGYGLAVDEDQLDLLAFRSLVERARQLRSAAELPRAYELYTRVARTWRAEPLAELAVLADDPVVVGLVRQWRSVVTEYAAVGAALGRYEDVVPLLRRLVAVDPLNEVAHARLMVALAGSGRQAEALVIFDALRRRLDREVGTAPGPELVDAHRRVLRQEVVWPATVVTRAHRTLPPDIAEFTGRAAQLQRLHDALESAPRMTSATLASRSDSSAPRPTAPVPATVAIEGMAGVGKTRLAIRFAHQLLAAGRYADQQLYADLRGYADHPPADPAVVLASFLYLLGVPGDQLPADLAGRAVLYRDRLRGRPAVVVLDNAASAQQLAPLLPDSPTTLVLVTSRRSLDLSGARLPLDVFTPREAVDLLAVVAGPDRVEADPAAARRVVDQCGRLPLAVALVARRLQARPALTLNDMDTRLADPGQRLGELTAGGRSVRAAFDLSYRALPSDVQRHFRLLAAHAPQDLGVDSVAALAGTTRTAARRTLNLLLREHLVTVRAANRYRVPDLLRAYADSVGGTADGSGQ